MYRLKLTRSATQDLKKLDHRYQLAVAKALDRLTQNPTVGEPLRGKLKGCWKLRFSRYRIIYQIIHRQLIIIVFQVQHRRQVYR